MDLINRQAAIEMIKGLPTWWADAGGYYGGAQPSSGDKNLEGRGYGRIAAE